MFEFEFIVNYLADAIVCSEEQENLLTTESDYSEGSNDFLRAVHCTKCLCQHFLIN